MFYASTLTKALDSLDSYVKCYQFIAYFNNNKVWYVAKNRMDVCNYYLIHSYLVLLVAYTLHFTLSTIAFLGKRVQTHQPKNNNIKPQAQTQPRSPTAERKRTLTVSSVQMEWIWVPNITEVKMRKRRPSKHRRMRRMTVAGGEKVLHSGVRRGEGTHTALTHIQLYNMLTTIKSKFHFVYV